MNNPIILVDFDGVISNYESGWKGPDVIPDPPVPGAIEFLEALLPPLDKVDSYTGPIAQIYSSRSKSREGVEAMKRWLVKHGLREEYITRGSGEYCLLYYYCGSGEYRSSNHANLE